MGFKCLQWLQTIHELSLDIFQAGAVEIIEEEIFCFGIHGLVVLNFQSKSIHNAIISKEMPVIQLITREPVKSIVKVGKEIFILLDEKGTVMTLKNQKFLHNVFSLTTNAMILESEGIAIRVFDENIHIYKEFMCGPAIQGNFKVQSIKIVSNESKKFYGTLVGKPNIQSDLVFFSDKNILYWFEANDDFMTQVARNFSSDLHKFWLENSFVICLLEDGTVEVLYLSKYDMISQKVYLFSRSLWCCEFFLNKLIISDGEDVYFLEVNLTDHELEFRRTTYELSGVIGITFYEKSDSIFAITENNMLYLLNFTIEHKEIDPNEMVDVNDSESLEKIEYLDKLLTTGIQEIKRINDKTNRIKASITFCENKFQPSDLNEKSIQDNLYSIEDRNSLISSDRICKISKTTGTVGSKMAFLARDDLFILKETSTFSKDISDVTETLCNEDPLVRMKKFFGLPVKPTTFEYLLQCKENDLITITACNVEQLKFKKIMKWQQILTNGNGGADLTIEENCESCGQSQITKPSGISRKKGDCQVMEKTHKICKIELQSKLRHLQGFQLTGNGLLQFYLNLRKTPIYLKIK